MNILAVLSAYRPAKHIAPVGGGEISNRELLGEMAKRGHEVTVFAFNSGGVGERTEDGVHVIDGGLGRRESALRRMIRATGAKQRLKKELDSSLPNVILASASTVGLALKVSKGCGAPVVVLIRALRDMHPSPASLAKRAGKFLVYGGSSWSDAPCLIANSQFLLDRCRQDGFTGRGWVVYPPVDVDIATHEWPATVRSICMVGSSDAKGISTFLLLAARMPDVSFKVIGDRSVSPDSSAVTGNVTRVGWTSSPVAEIDECDALLMPTRIEEAFGRAAVEAIRRKKYVIASRVGGLPEAVADQLLLVAPEDLDGWHTRISKLVRDPGAFTSAMDKALDVARGFDLPSQAGRLEEAIRDIAGTPRGGD